MACEAEACKEANGSGPQTAAPAESESVFSLICRECWAEAQPRTLETSRPWSSWCCWLPLWKAACCHSGPWEPYCMAESIGRASDGASVGRARSHCACLRIYVWAHLSQGCTYIACVISLRILDIVVVGQIFFQWPLQATLSHLVHRHSPPPLTFRADGGKTMKTVKITTTG